MLKALLGTVAPYLEAVKIGLVAIAVLAVFGAGYHVRGWRDDAAQLSAVRVAVAKANEDAAFQYQAALAAVKHTEEVRVVTQTLTKEVTRWRDRPVAHAVCLDPDGVRLANDALAGKAPARPEPDATLPRVVRRPDDR